jgi:glycosyltransferase involved in cell wall biosynthesis
MDIEEKVVTLHNSAEGSQQPVFGMIILGGGTNGASIRDIRLANELAQRGYRVHVWWALDTTSSQVLDPSIEQHWLFHGFRYTGNRFRETRDRFGQKLASLFPDQKRAHVVQKRPKILNGLWHGLMRAVCEGIERDSRLLRRFADQVAQAGITHMLPALEVFCPWAAAAKKIVPQRLRYLLTFQGYEVYGNYARQVGLEQEFYARIVDLVAQSDWPAIAVSADYAERIVEDVGVSRDQMVAIPPGIPIPEPLDRQQALESVIDHFESFQPDVPVVSFVGRRDTEKGIDLLLYATKILRQSGHEFQVCVCGPTAFGRRYAETCEQIAEELRTPIEFRRFISDGLRAALFAASRFVVYPSIHREPFGMVPVEAMAQGTPAIVPDYGGVAEAISAKGESGGLQFNVWDSGQLAHRMAQLLEDDQLHSRLSEAAPRVAQYYSVSNLVDRLLDHLQVQPHQRAAKDSRRQSAA